MAAVVVVAAVIAAVQAVVVVLPRPPYLSRPAILLRSMSEAVAVREPLMDRRAVAEEEGDTAR